MENIMSRWRREGLSPWLVVEKRRLVINVALGTESLSARPGDHWQVGCRLLGG